MMALYKNDSNKEKRPLDEADDYHDSILALLEAGEYKKNSSNTAGSTNTNSNPKKEGNDDDWKYDFSSFCLDDDGGALFVCSN